MKHEYNGLGTIVIVAAQLRLPKILVLGRAGGPLLPKYKLYVVVVAGIIVPAVEVLPSQVTFVVAKTATLLLGSQAL